MFLLHDGCSMFNLLCSTLILMFCIQSSGFRLNSDASMHRRISAGGLKDLTTNPGMSNVISSSIKLPIVQLINEGELIGEFMVGNEMDGAIVKLKAVLNQLDASVNTTVSRDSVSTISGGETSVQNVYSDDMLTRALNDSARGYFVLKIYQTACQRCSEFDPIFNSIAIESTSTSNSDQNIFWIQAKAEDIPNYVKKTRKRILGIEETADSLDMMMECSICNGLGVVTCPECGGDGHSMRGQYAVICPRCGGSKRVRCDACGGKCIHCD